MKPDLVRSLEMKQASLCDTLFGSYITLIFIH